MVFLFGFKELGGRVYLKCSIIKNDLWCDYYCVYCDLRNKVTSSRLIVFLVLKYLIIINSNNI